MSLGDIVDEAIYDVFKHILVKTGHKNTKVVFDKENGLEPKNTYCVVSILDRKRVGMTDRSTYLTQNSEMWQTEHFEICLQLTFLGKSSRDIAWDFDDSFPSCFNFLEELQKRNLGYLRKSKLRRNPQPRETEWVDAWAVDIDLSFAIQSRYEMDWVEFITVDGELYRVYLPELQDRTTEDENLRTTEDGSVRQVLPEY